MKYEPGTFALVQRNGADWHRAMFTGDGDWVCLHGLTCKPEYVRPLVTLDPEDREQVERLTEEFRSTSGWSAGVKREAANAMQHALRSLTKPPKPAEPVGRYAVVVDSAGAEWLRRNPGDMWFAQNEMSAGVPSFRARRYADIDAVTVLSEGVTA